MLILVVFSWLSLFVTISKSSDKTFYFLLGNQSIANGTEQNPFFFLNDSLTTLPLFSDQNILLVLLGDNRINNFSANFVLSNFTKGIR